MQRILGVVCLSVVLLPIELGILIPSDAPAAVERIAFEGTDVSEISHRPLLGPLKRKKTAPGSTRRRKRRRQAPAPMPAAIAIERVRVIRI